MALVSPGISITINDQSQYVNSNVGSVPLVILATAQDKVNPSGTTAVGTTKANAGKLLAFTSQRDLITQMGTPSFELTSSNTPVHGSEINEYGLMAGYSALGLGNQLFAIRADVDLNELKGTSIRPVANPVDGTYWLDHNATQWGIKALNATTGEFSVVQPLLITDSTKIFADSGYANLPSTPVSSIGSVGDYAIPLVSPTGATPATLRLFYKAGANSAQGAGLNNTWVQVGGENWQKAVPTVTGTGGATNPFTSSTTYTCTINTETVTFTGATSVSAFATAINNAGIDGIFAGTVTNSSGTFLTLFVTSAAKSLGTTPDGSMLITDGANTPLAILGIKPSSGTNNNATVRNTTGRYYAPYLFYGNYAQTPALQNGTVLGWYAQDNAPRPSGSIWWVTTPTNEGFNPSLKKYKASTDTFESLYVPMYSGPAGAIASLDPTGGGLNITHGQVAAFYSVIDPTDNNLRFVVQNSSTQAVGVGAEAGTFGTFNIADTFTIQSTTIGSAVFTETEIELTGTNATSFVSDILAANIPYVTASYNEVTNAISITHTTGGQINMYQPGGSDAINAAGFSAVAVGNGGSGFIVSNTGVTTISGWDPLTARINFSDTAPYTAPVSGTQWYYSNLADADIMVNDGTGWKGYRTVGYDSRGYNLGLTDINGPIVSPTEPITQSNGSSSLVEGDLWLDSGDHENYPALYRYNGSKFVAIDKTDHVTANGIIFADARWDTNGQSDIISDELPPIHHLVNSSYTDLDAPDYRLYPRGILMFNTRRSGYNVKRYVPNYFNADSFPNQDLPEVKDAWVLSSGLDQNHVAYAGQYAQRAIVVSAMRAAVDSNLDVLSPVYNFNLICAPGYPELIPNMITLNDNRGDTAFIIGDTPMQLAPNVVDITNWANNTDGTGLSADASANAYLALYYPAGLTNDLDGNTVVVPASHAVLRTFLYNDQVSHPWFAPAGTHRGLVSNLMDIGYLSEPSYEFVHNGISQGLRDALATLNINPITQLPGTGLVVFGQLTRSGTSTARNRINVVRLENYLRTVFNSIANGYLFEPNDQITRNSIAREIELALHNVLSLRGLYDFLVQCDSNNNTPATISNNQLYVDVAIEPTRDVEFIYIPIAIYNPGSIAALNRQST